MAILVMQRGRKRHGINFPIENIEVEFFIVKRKLFESDDFVIRRIHKYFLSEKSLFARQTNLIVY